MRKGVFIAFSLSVVAAAAFADETLPVLQVGNEVYSNVNVMRVSATDIYFTSDKGLANAKLKDLNPALQRHFNFNPTNAAAIERKQKAANTQYHLQALESAATQPPANEPSSSGGEKPPPGAQKEPETGKLIWAKPLLNQKAPPLVVEKWLTPPPDARGKFVLIDFWATRYAPCRAVLARLDAFQREFGDKLAVISITRDPEDVVRQMTGKQVGHHFAIDTQGRTEKMVGVTAEPHVLVIDPQGFVRWEGYPLLEGHELDEKTLAEIFDRYSR